MSAAELSPVKQALVELQTMRSRLATLERATREPIAIIGMGCRLPGSVNGPDDLWRLLSDGVDAVGEIPAERWEAGRFFDPDPAVSGKMSTRWGGFIDSVSRFDAPFFGISPREANTIDPQQRILLEVAWEALEHAGQSPDRLTGSSTGVFVGISGFDYAHLAMGAPPEDLGPHLAPGIAHSAASGRIAYALGLQGPALSVDTACSSSLLAIHLAVQSLRRGECRMALAGGVNTILLPTFQIGFSKSGMMAADGRCKTFDASADGFVRGEGCGVLVLKRLADAERDADPILAIIRGSAVNQDGRSSGMTAPNGLAQEAVIRAALEDAGVEGKAIGYVEAHGTGTPLGDPVEVNALAAALGPDRESGRPLLVGSLKTNLGHLEAAAGVAGVMKAALALGHGSIPASLHFREPNPYVSWETLPVAVVATTTPFPATDGRRLAGVSSFGFTGTNVHVILESPASAVEEGALRRRAAAAPPGQDESVAPAGDPHVRLLKLSARDEAALTSLAGRWSDFLAGSDACYTDLCYTANTGRADLPLRLAVVARSSAEAGALLRLHAAGDPAPGVVTSSAPRVSSPRVAFLFTGHGAQYPGMARGLYATEPVFRAALDRCDAALGPYLDRTVVSILYPRGANEGGEALESVRSLEADPLLDTMLHSQAALFSIQYALEKLWRSWGVEPAAVLGHSVGEYAAGVCAGVLDLDDAAKLVTARGRLMDSVAGGGAMLAILATEDEVAPLLASQAGAVAVAAVNGPKELVISGERAAIESIQRAMVQLGIECRPLAVACAAHSRQLDPILDEFEAVARSIRFRDPELPLVSCTTGELARADEITTARYWRRHLREPVRFAAGINALRLEGCGTFLEIGPHTNLVGMGRRCLPDDDSLRWIPSLRRKCDDRQQVLESLAELYVHGVAIDWEGFEREEPARAGGRRRVAAPTYAWQHQSYWLEHERRASPVSTTEGYPERVWRRLVDAGKRQEAQGPLDLSLASFPARWESLGRLTTAIAGNTLAGLGSTLLDGEWTAAELVARLGLTAGYERLLDRWLHRLVRAGSLSLTPEGVYTAHVAPSAAELDAAWLEATARCGDWAFLLDYLRRCEELLPNVLTGVCDPVETLFPRGSFTTADALYRDSVLPRYYNAIAHALVSSLLDGRPGERISLLEVGAGTGGTSAALVPLLDEAGGTYLFTDVSDFFLARASERLGGYGALRLGLFDVQKDPATQGYAAESFDIIVAANVLHATRDLRQALTHLRSLLAPGGVLLLVEVTAYLDWFDISTALLEGWDLQGDDLRSEHPMIPADQWADLLREAGFVHVAAFPSPDSPAEIMAQHVIVGHAPGAPADLSAAREAGEGMGSQAGESLHSTSPRTAADAFARQLDTASGEERVELLVAYVRQHVAALLRLGQPERIERSGRLMDLGLDSLLAVELRNRLSSGLPLVDQLPATLLFDHPTVESIVALISRTLWDDDRRGSPSESHTGGEWGLLAHDPLDGLGDTEIEARLLARLDAMEDSAP